MISKTDTLKESLKQIIQMLIFQWETLKDSGHQVLRIMHWTCLITGALAKTFIRSQLIKLDSVIRMGLLSRKLQVRDNTINNNGIKELQEKWLKALLWASILSHLLNVNLEKVVNISSILTIIHHSKSWRWDEESTLAFPQMNHPWF